MAPEVSMRRSMAVVCAFFLASVVASAAPPARKPAARSTVAPARKLPPHAGRVFGLTFSEDGHTLVSGSADETVRVYAIPSGDLQLTLPGHGGGAGEVVLSRAANRLAVSCYDGTVKIWALPEGRLVGTVQGPEGTGHHLAVSRDQKLLAIGSQDGTIQMVELSDASKRQTIAAHAGGIQALEFDRFDRLYSSGTDRMVKAWHPMDGELLGSMGPQRGPSTRLAFTFAEPPLGAHVMSGGNGVEIWSNRGYSDYTMRARIDAHTGFLNGMEGAWDGDGSTFVTGGGDGAIRIWSIPDGKLVQTIRAHPGVNGLDRMVLSEDGSTLVSAGWNGTVKVWTLPGGALRATYVDAKDWLQSLALSEDGRWLAEGLQDGQVLLRDLGAAR
jgi:WD40 repeat protein